MKTRTQRVELAIGMPVPPLLGWSPMSGPITVDTRSAERGALIFVFAPSCGPCQRNWTNWRVLREKLMNRYDVISVDVTAAADSQFLSDRGLRDVPLVIYTAPASATAYALVKTPQTLLLRRGAVLGVWTGVLDERTIHAIETVAIGGW